MTSPRANPERLGPWILERRLGQGAFGAVFVARHADVPERVRAVKWIASRDERTLERVQREAELLARVSHPGVVRIHEVGRAEGGMYLVLDLVEGEPLTAVLARHQAGLPFAQACALAAAIGRAIGAAHAKGVVHRDLKPDNVLATAEGAKVIDFGLALSEDAERLTRTGVTVGTMGYMAPEQLDARRDLQSPATDVYALGAIFYELLTGRPLVSGTSVERLVASSGGRYVPATRVRPELPSEVDALLIRALAQEPRHRYADGNAFAAAVDQLLSKKPADVEKQKRAVAGRVAAWSLGAGALLAALFFGGRAAARVLFLQVEDVERLNRRARAVLLRPDPAEIDALQKDRRELKGWELDAAKVRLRELDERLRVLALVRGLDDPDRAKAVAAAGELAKLPEKPQDLVGRLRDVLLKEERDPVKLRRAIEVLCAGARDGPTRSALAVSILPYALEEPAPRRRAVLAAAHAELPLAYESIAQTEARKLEENAKLGGSGELTPAADVRAGLDSAIEKVEALAQPLPTKARGELPKIAARLLLERARHRRRDDPVGALDDRLAALDVAPDVPSPPWYPGFLSRQVIAFYEPATQATGADRERITRDLARFTLEAMVEDADWGWGFALKIQLADVLRGRLPSDLANELIQNELATLMREFPTSSDSIPSPLLENSWDDLPPRLQPLAKSLVRRMDLHIPKVPPLDESSARDLASDAVRLVEHVKVPDPAVAELEAQRATELEAAVLAGLEKEDATDPDVAQSIRLSRQRLANYFNAWARVGPRERLFRRAPVRDAPVQPLFQDQVDRCAREIHERLERALAVCPTTGEYTRLGLHAHLCAFLLQVPQYVDVIAAFEKATRDPLYIEAAKDPSSVDFSRIESMLSIGSDAIVAYLNLDPPRVAEAENLLALRRALVKHANPTRAIEANPTEASHYDKGTSEIEELIEAAKKRSR